MRIAREASHPLRIWIGAALVGIAAFILCGVCWSTASAQPDREEGPRKEAFRSGGARSEDVLKEIAGTLKRIDQRLERIEKVVVDGAKPAAAPAAK